LETIDKKDPIIMADDDMEVTTPTPLEDNGGKEEVEAATDLSNRYVLG
jgi:hypothetical protein